jgi:phosphoesterase RecJ-like protein
MESSLRLEFETFRNIIETGRKFVLTTHINPDGDGLGCEVALWEFLTERGKTASIINHSATPYYYQFLDPQKAIQQFSPDQHARILIEADGIIVLDTNSPDRLASMKPFVLDSKATKVCIDHHLDKVEFADLYILDELSAATGAIVYRLLQFLGVQQLSPIMATALYTAIMTDTGSFRFPKTDPTIHRQVAHLIECGADPVSIYQNVYEQGSVGRLLLLGKVLSTLRTEANGKIACIVATKEMFQETGTSEMDTDNMINYTLSIKGVQIGLMLTEIEGAVKIGFRSKGDIGIHKLAQEFGGNGHKNAAGARIPHSTLADLLPKVLERAQHYTV